MPRILIGVDDTDNDTSIGTGRLARQLAAECQARGMPAAGVTRHQFLVDPAIPYTSHNSGACIMIDADADVAAATFAFEFVAERSAGGSDPGVCIASVDQVSGELMEFGRAASREVLKMEQTFALAERAGLLLRGLGGTCQGVIGALASVGQCAGGNEGRFLDLPGLRLLHGCVRRRQYEEMGIRVEHQTEGVQPAEDDRYDTLDWVRPRLIGGEPVLIVEWSSARNAWVPVDRKRNHPPR
jgi:tRNA(Ile2) C34 agmatinyltransferase TiaS